MPGFVVAARPMLSPAVTRPSANIMCKVTFVERLICMPRSKKAGIRADMMSMTQASAMVSIQQ